MMNRIVFDVGHPAQVHNFKYVHSILKSKGWNSSFTLKNKEIAALLLQTYGIPFQRLFANKSNIFLNLVCNVLNIGIFSCYCIIKRPTLIISRGSFHSVIVSNILRITHIMLSDTEHSRDFSNYVDVTLTNNSFRKKLGKNHIRFNSNIELFYLHPNYFSRPTKRSAQKEKKILIRFVSWNAHHDKGMVGLSLQQKINAVKSFSKYGRVYISSEKELPVELKQYQIKISPEEMHIFISQCSIVYGESATMASEAAMLGVPAIYHDNFGRGYTDEEETYGLVYNYSESESDQKAAIDKGIDILNLSESVITDRYNLFMENKIDPVKFLIWFIENYPKSRKIMLENPEYQNIFR
ncbi:MAG: hypothetical protein Q7U54_12425 [Bacteroidales bacterium]|nr:hypothetical protein [Bacteroidales bacterium]